MSPEIERRIIDYIKANIGDMTAVVMSDYGIKTISRSILRLVIEQCRLLAIPCIVDSRYNIKDFTGVTLVKQNEAETAAALGYGELDEVTLIEAGNKLLTLLDAEAVLVTRGPDGMSLFERSGNISHIPVTNVSEVFDVTGAGDTAVVTVALALAAGACYLDAAKLANFAAGVVVRKPGTATTTADELKEAVGGHHEGY